MIEPPALAVSVEAFKRAVHLDGPDDDLLIAELLAAATEVVETAVRRALMPRLVAFEIPAGRWSRWYFPLAPVIEVVEISDPAARLVRGFTEPALERPAATEGAVSLTALCGHEDPARIPRGLCQAVILLAKEWHDAGIGPAENAPPLSFGIQRLIRQARYARPMVSE
uniref:hypothetical protein n=1 Tax=Cereibacter sphaeroides TaxID=1063 RepID=UPI001E40DC38|nr:hypothetical protein [Cereibacter sphaeroides]